jgi:hypothetical protein
LYLGVHQVGRENNFAKLIASLTAFGSPYHSRRLSIGRERAIWAEVAFLILSVQ